MFRHFFETNGDPLVYGDIAKNLLLHGRYALTLGSGQAFPTLDSPARLSALSRRSAFKLFGIENYAAAVWRPDCDGSGRLPSSRRLRPPHCAAAASRPAPCTPRSGSPRFAPLPPLCRESADRRSDALCHLRSHFGPRRVFRNGPAWASALAFTFAVTFAALLRPDGALAAIALAPALFLGLRNAAHSHTNPASALRMAVVCALLALAPFAVWTCRNGRVFHVFQPLAPRSATDPGDPVTPGWDRWVKTWCLDFVSTYNVVWNVPGDELDISKTAQPRL